VFYIISMLMFMIGVYSSFNKKWSFLLFSAMIAIIPSSTGMSAINSLMGVYFYDFYFFGLSVAIFTTYCMNRGTNKEINGKLIFVVFFSSALFFLSVLDVGLSKYIIKDMRPYIFISMFYLIWTWHGDVKDDDNNQVYAFILLVVILSVCTNLIYVLANMVDSDNIKDEFYQQNSYRFLDASTYMCAVYVLYFFSMKRMIDSKLELLALIAALACVLISNSRFILFSIFLSITLVNFKRPKFFIITMLISVILIGAFLFFSQFIEAERVTSSLSVEGILSQLTVRYSPAIDLIKEMSWWNYIVGIGIGTPFYIPWFDYRDTVDLYNVNIDSGYLTFYVKNGIFMLVPIYFFYDSIACYSKRNFKNAIGIFLVSMLCVSATPYQIYSIGLIVMPILLNMTAHREELNNENKETI